jgi:hypothetical protein
MSDELFDLVERIYRAAREGASLDLSPAEVELIAGAIRAGEQLDRPGVCFVFSMPSGPALGRCWTWREVFNGKAPDWIFRPDPPYWLIGRGTAEPPETEWHDPLRPIEYRGRVDPAMIDVAHDWVSAAGGRPWPTTAG